MQDLGTVMAIKWLRWVDKNIDDVIIKINMICS